MKFELEFMKISSNKCKLPSQFFCLVQLASLQESTFGNQFLVTEQLQNIFLIYFSSGKKRFFVECDNSHFLNSFYESKSGWRDLILT